MFAIHRCFLERDFLVYFKFKTVDGEPDAFFNNTKAEEYRLKFEEGDPDYFGNVYDVNGCHLYELENFVSTSKDKAGGTTLPVT